MSGWINGVSFRADIALLILGLKRRTSRTDNTLFTIPQWLFVRAFAFIVDEDFVGGAFADLGGGVDCSRSGTITFAGSSVGVEFGALWACFALFGDWIEELPISRVALDTVVGNLVVTFIAF